MVSLDANKSKGVAETAPFTLSRQLFSNLKKAFYSQPNYSSWWSGIFWVIILSNLINYVSRCKHKQGSGLDGPFKGGLYPKNDLFLSKS